MTHTTPILNKTSAHIANIFLDHCNVPFGIAAYLLTDSRRVVRSLNANSLVPSADRYLGLNHFKTTAYHPQTNSQAEQYNRTIVTRLWHYISDHQKNWDPFFQPLTCTYNMQVHRSTVTFPYGLFISCHPPGPLLLNSTTISTKGNVSETSPQAVGNLLWQPIHALYSIKTSHMIKSKSRYKSGYDIRVREMPRNVPGSYVFIHNPPIRATKEPPPPPQNKHVTDCNHEQLLRWKYYKDTIGLLVIDDNWIPYTIPIDRATQTSLTSLTTSAPPNLQLWAKPKSLPQHWDKSAHSDTEYVVDHTARHIGKKPSVKYVVEWYGYGPRHYTVKPVN